MENEERIKVILGEYLEDKPFRKWWEERMKLRITHLSSLGQLVTQFLSGQLDITSFRTKLDIANKSNDDPWGFNGTSGQMFFNLLVKGGKKMGILDDIQQQLRNLIIVPDTPEIAKSRINTLFEFCTEKFGKTIGPKRSSFFLSFFWAIQQPRKFPIIYESGRLLLKNSGVLIEEGVDAGSFYVRFIEAYKETEKIIKELDNKCDSFYEVEGFFYKFYKGLKEGSQEQDYFKIVNRAEDGSIKQKAFKIPILLILAENPEGCQPVKMYDEIEKRMVITPIEKEKTNFGEEVWKNRLRWAKQKLVDEKNVIIESETGFWKITQQGMQFLTNLKTGSARTEDKSEQKSEQKQRYWQISPGDGARLWPRMKEEGTIAVGWSGTPDFSGVDSKDKLFEMLKLADQGKTLQDTQTQKLWGFLNDVKIGDKIIANKGKSKIVGVGEITSDYYYDSVKPEYKHTKKVRWYWTGEMDIPMQGKFGTTIIELSSDEFDSLTDGLVDENHVLADSPEWKLEPIELENQLKNLYFDDITGLCKNICGLLNAGKNIILIGPPGTGKTDIANAIGRLSKPFMRNNDGESFIFSTATSDWTTFDTIGGFMPSKNSSQLEFSEGQFLTAIAEDKILVIDEINRAEIDKAFGQLFTVLSGQNVELPFKLNDRPIKLCSDHRRNQSGKEGSIYSIGNNWRIIATMNTLDKAALYQMSYAFMRRFAFVHIGNPIKRDLCLTKINEKLDLSPSVINNMGGLWNKISEGNTRQIGPAIIASILKVIKERNVDSDSDEFDKVVADGIISFILPQFEGANRETELKPLAKALEEYKDYIGTFFEEMLDSSIEKLIGKG